MGVAFHIHQALPHPRRELGAPTWASLVLLSSMQPTPQVHPLSQDSWRAPSLGRSVLGPRTGSRFPGSPSVCSVSGWRDQATRRFGWWSLGSTVPSPPAVYCLDPTHRHLGRPGPFPKVSTQTCTWTPSICRRDCPCARENRFCRFL